MTTCRPRAAVPSSRRALSPRRAAASLHPASLAILLLTLVLVHLPNSCRSWSEPRWAGGLSLRARAGPYSVLRRCSFVPRKAASLPPRRFRGTNRIDRSIGVSSGTGLTMLRNFDLPETIVFYGMDSALDPQSSDAASAVRPGVMRLLTECSELGTAAILLSETIRVSEMEARASETELARFVSDGTLHLRSSLDEMTFPPESDDLRLPFGAGGIGHAPSPAALLDALSSVVVQPRGFGGSSGFGTKDADPPRPPLPKHVVAFVSGPGPRSRARCSASRMAGVRVVYIERDGLGSCDAEDLADAVVETLGGEDDWEVVTLDGISTPGSYWLNPPNPRDDAGDRVSIEDAVELFRAERMGSEEAGAMSAGMAEALDDVSEDEMDEEELNRILADLDPL